MVKLLVKYVLKRWQIESTKRINSIILFVLGKAFGLIYIIVKSIKSCRLY